MGMSVRINGKDQTEPLDVVIRKTYAQTTALFHKLNALQVQVQELREDQTRLRSVVLTLLADPQAREDALAVLKDFKFNKGNPK